MELISTGRPCEGTVWMFAPREGNDVAVPRVDTEDFPVPTPIR
jgi:hypothetical protein